MFSYFAIFKVEELIETEQRRRRRENLEEEDEKLGGERNFFLLQVPSLEKICT